MKRSGISKEDNPFTKIGLKIAIINDLNNLRHKIESIEKYLDVRNDSDHVAHNFKEEFGNE